MTEYICGHCPPTDEAFRSGRERDVRIHISNSKNARHEGITGSSPEAVILSAGTDDNGGLSIPLATDEAKSKIAERIYAAYLHFPHLEVTDLSELTGHAVDTITKHLGRSQRIRVERDRRALEYFNEKQLYGGDRELATDEEEREILAYVKEHPEDTAEDVINALDLSVSEEEIVELCREKMLPPRLPRREHHKDIILATYEDADNRGLSIEEMEPEQLNISEIARNSDVAWDTVRDAIERYPVNAYKPHKIAELAFGEELEEQYEMLLNRLSIRDKSSVAEDDAEKDEVDGISVSSSDVTEEATSKSDLKREKREAGNVKFEGVPIDARMQNITERPVKGTPVQSEEEAESVDETDKDDTEVAPGEIEVQDEEVTQVESAKTTEGDVESTSMAYAAESAESESSVGQVTEQETEQDTTNTSELLVPTVTEDSVLSDDDIVYLIRLVVQDDEEQARDDLIQRLAQLIQPPRPQ